MKIFIISKHREELLTLATTSRKEADQALVDHGPGGFYLHEVELTTPTPTFDSLNQIDAIIAEAEPDQPAVTKGRRPKPTKPEREAGDPPVITATE